MRANGARFWVCMALILAIVFIVLINRSRGAELAITECHATRGNTAQGWWSWREIAGRKCYYIGRPNKPKSELRWSKAAVSKTSEVATQPQAMTKNAMNSTIYLSDPAAAPTFDPLRGPLGKIWFVPWPVKDWR